MSLLRNNYSFMSMLEPGSEGGRETISEDQEKSHCLRKMEQGEDTYH